MKLSTLLAAVAFSFFVVRTDGRLVIACKADGSSHECVCSKLEEAPFIVNCGFLRAYPKMFRDDHRYNQTICDDCDDPVPLPDFRVSDVTMYGIPLDLAAEVDELYMYNNSLRRFGGRSDLRALTGLKVLNLRYNDLKGLEKGQLAFNTELLELILEDNQITELEKDAFAALGNLELLRLGGNQLTELPEELFQGTVRLKVLRLENNGLTKLEPKLFDFQSTCTSCLEELHLQRNALTELVEGIFAPLKGLKRLFLQVNPDLKLVPLSIFQAGQVMTASLERMSMLGSASACTKASKDTDVQCTCAAGYVDGTNTQTGSYCIPVVCPDEIEGLTAQALATCGAGQEYLSTCDAKCATGYVGKATYTCQPKPNSQDGHWVTDTPDWQCVAKSCSATIPENAFGRNTVHSQSTAEAPTCSGEQLEYGSPNNCDVQCAEGFLPKEGTSTLFTCGADQVWIPAGAPETKLVCERVDCGAKVTQLKPGRFEYVTMVVGSDKIVEECTGRNGDTVYEEECRVQCAEGYREYETETDETTGVTTPIKKDYVCEKDGLWEFPDGSLDCRGKRCGRNAPVAENVIARCLGDVTFGGDKCGVSCENGFKPISELVRDYCSVYQDTCPTEFREEFGDGRGDADDPLKICYFEAERSTIGTFPLETEAEASQNTIACRVSYIFSDDDGEASVGGGFQLDCNKGRLANNEQCAERVCRDGSVECLTCNEDGTWQESELQCKPVECPVLATRGTDESGFDAIRDAACENLGTFTVKAREECLAKFDRLADPESGTNCADSNEFGNLCPISCKHGYNPKNSPFRCDADQLAQGVWVGELDCNPVQCPIDVKDTTVDGTVYLEGVDPDALVTSLIEDPDCPLGTRIQFQPLAGSANAGNESAAGVVETGECATVGTYDPTQPTKIQAKCSDGDVTETYTLKCDDPSWAVESIDDGPLKDSDRDLFDWQKNGSRFCRRDCGEFLGFSVEQDRRAGYCQGYAEGDQCIGICKLNRNYSVTLVCDWQTQTWIADPNENYEYDENNNPTDVLYDGNICENLFTTTSTTTTTIPVEASRTLSAGAQAAVIVVPLIILVSALFVVLYYFGCLKVCGLQATQPKHEIYGQIYGEMFGMAGNDIYAAAVETRKRNIKIAKQKKKEFNGPSIAGRTGGKNKAAPRPPAANNAPPRSTIAGRAANTQMNPVFNAPSTIAGRARASSGSFD